MPRGKIFRVELISKRWDFPRVCKGSVTLKNWETVLAEEMSNLHEVPGNAALPPHPPCAHWCILKLPPLSLECSMVDAL